ncbi:hypothetical protein [Sorangium sp. So ce1078]|uniref:hypothetical protein n=1 Tax=Sorangium sp. So ce1078 TaxID=3133329 RepID=UPI003F62E226
MSILGAALPAFTLGCGDVIEIGWESSVALVNGVVGPDGEAACERLACACENPGPSGSGPVWEGNYFITDDASVAALASYSAITGGLVIDSDITVTTVSLPQLTYAGGVWVYQSALTHLDLSGLAHAGDISIQENNGLTSVNLEKLATVCSGVNFYLNSSLANLSLGSLSEVGVGLQLYDMATSSLDLSSLRSVGDGLQIMFTSATTVDLTSLKHVGWHVAIHGNAALANFGPSPLESVGAHFIAYNNPALTSLDLPDLKTVGSDMDVKKNGLTSLGLGGLTSVGGDGNFELNPALPSCSVDAIAPVFTGAVTNIGNSGVGPCL